MGNNECDTNFCLLPSAVRVLEHQYLQKDEDRSIIETPEQMFRRVAHTIALGDSGIEEKFFKMMTNFDFLPNSPTLMNAGTEIGQLSACFVLPIEDDLKSIMQGITDAAMIHKSGGGTGFTFSKLRPKGDVVKKTGGIASGPLSFMNVYDCATNVIKQGGKRRGANMGIMEVNHPDIYDFIVAKETEGFLSNFNLSVAITDEFLNAVQKDLDFDLINPRTKKVSKTVKARSIWNLLITMTWRNGEPAIIFIDTINKHNPLLETLGRIEATNPCAEQPLYPYESCNLGSINLSKFVREDNKIDFKRMEETVRLAVIFLDNVIDINKYPLQQIEEMSKKTRKIGLGVMGFADMLIKMKVKYNEPRAVKIAEKISKFVTEVARSESRKLGELKGDFPLFTLSSLTKKYSHMRNATVTTIAPTGSISLIAGCSSGIEPLFDVKLVKNLTETVGKEFKIEHPLYDDEHKKYFVTALELKPEEHIAIQSAFQKYTDNAVSKTINLSYNATIDDIEKAYLLAYKSGCKGVALYRNGSRKKQIVEIVEK